MSSQTISPATLIEEMTPEGRKITIITGSSAVTGATTAASGGQAQGQPRRERQGTNTGRPVPKEYWEQGRPKAMLGGEKFFPKKVDNQWFIFEATGGSGQKASPIQWNNFLYRYNLPFHITGQDMNMVRDGIKQNGGKFRGAKTKDKQPIPGGDNKWYCNMWLEELREYAECVAAEVLPEPEHLLQGAPVPQNVGDPDLDGEATDDPAWLFDEEK